MDTQKILDDLTYNTEVFPRQSLQEAMANREQITPVLQKAKKLPAELYQEDYMAHVYALYLLAQFRDQLAYSLIVEFFSITDKIIVDRMANIVTEDLHHILASVAHGDTVLN